MTAVTPVRAASSTSRLVDMFSQPTANVTMTPEFLETFSKTAMYRPVLSQQLGEPALIKAEPDQLYDESSMVFDFETQSESGSPSHSHTQTSEISAQSHWCEDNAFSTLSPPASTSFSHKSSQISNSDAPHMSVWATAMGLRPMSPPPTNPCSPSFRPPTHSSSSKSSSSLCSNDWGMLNWGTHVSRVLSPPVSASFSLGDERPWQRHDSPSPPDENFLASLPPDFDEGASIQEEDMESLLADQVKQELVDLPSAHGGSDEKPPKKGKDVSVSIKQKKDRPSKRPRIYASRAEGKGSEQAKQAKRMKFLERNRVAAAKCRDKKRNWTDNLGFRARDLKEQNALLGATVDTLQEEVFFLKDQIQKHETCDES